MDTLPGTVELLVALLDVLASLMDVRSKSDINIDYAEQLLLTALCAVSAKIEVRVFSLVVVLIDALKRFFPNRLSRILKKSITRFS